MMVGPLFFCGPSHSGSSTQGLVGLFCAQASLILLARMTFRSSNSPTRKTRPSSMVSAAAKRVDPTRSPTASTVCAKGLAASATSIGAEETAENPSFAAASVWKSIMPKKKSSGMRSAFGPLIMMAVQ
eukprot:scaffold63_cov306-Pinguiococcus_pyrenoidosus.AAC.72